MQHASTLDNVNLTQKIEKPRGITTSGDPLLEVSPMSVLFTVELRVACANDNKYLLAKNVIQQMALHAYERLALLDEGERPEAKAYAPSYEAGHVDLPLWELTTSDTGEMAEMNARLTGALSIMRRSDAGKPALRVIEGGKSSAAIQPSCS
jgi:hypothetical protein